MKTAKEILAHFEDDGSKAKANAEARAAFKNGLHPLEQAVSKLEELAKKLDSGNRSFAYKQIVKIKGAIHELNEIGS